MFTKKAFRKGIYSQLKETSRGSYAFQGLEAASLLRGSPYWSAYQFIYIFLSMPIEIDTRPVMEAAFKEGKKIFVPKVDTEGSGELIFFPILTPNGPWKNGAFGIREPWYQKPVFSETSYQNQGGNESSKEIYPAGPGDFPALILAPGLAFDRQGNRLGRGKGYYDRFFAMLDKERRDYTALGFCMDFQLMEKIPSEEHDKKMCGILTGMEIYLCQGS